ncbi:MAG: hypothetical protein JSW64_06060 [Candidatus Zixiibacteriota bacterium]|nr:MAG: hypothetical protein JSW64_06060 [candidate division Zixibacteria bacterium]
MIKISAKTNSSEKGIVLIVCVILLLMLAIVGIASLMTSDTEMDISGNSEHKISAFYLADAGVEKAYSILSGSPDWRSGLYNEQLGEGTYDVMVYDSLTYPYLGEKIMVRSTGRVGEANSTIEAIFAPKYRSPFQYGAYGRDTFDMLGGGMIDSYDSDLGSYASQAINGPDGNAYMYALENGHIRSEGDIKLGGNAQLHGDAITGDSGSFTFGGGTGIYGDSLRSSEHFPVDSIPSADIAYAQANNDASTNLTLTGTATYDPITNALNAGSGDSVIFNSGTYYFSSVDFTSSACLVLAPGADVTIYLTGMWDTSGGSVINTDATAANLHIYSTGTDFDFSGGTYLCAAIFAPNAEIVVTGGSHFFGSVIGRSFSNGGGTTLHFDEALLRIGNDLLLVGYDLERWREL